MKKYIRRILYLELLAVIPLVLAGLAWRDYTTQATSQTATKEPVMEETLKFDDDLKVKVELYSTDWQVNQDLRLKLSFKLPAELEKKVKSKDDLTVTASYQSLQSEVLDLPLITEALPLESHRGFLTSEYTYKSPLFKIGSPGEWQLTVKVEYENAYSSQRNTQSFEIIQAPIKPLLNQVVHFFNLGEQTDLTLAKTAFLPQPEVDKISIQVPLAQWQGIQGESDFTITRPSGMWLYQVVPLKVVWFQKQVEFSETLYLLAINGRVIWQYLLAVCLFLLMFEYFSQFKVQQLRRLHQQSQDFTAKQEHKRKVKEENQVQAQQVAAANRASQRQFPQPDLVLKQLNTTGEIELIGSLSAFDEAGQRKMNSTDLHRLTCFVIKPETQLCLPSGSLYLEKGAVVATDRYLVTKTKINLQHMATGELVPRLKPGRYQLLNGEEYGFESAGKQILLKIEEPYQYEGSDGA